MADDFERNERGHVIITITGINLTGEQEIKRLKTIDHSSISNYAKSCLASDSYDEKHRLDAGKTYKVALVPGNEIVKDSKRTTEKLLKFGKKCGYGKPLAGFIPRIQEDISDKQMKDMGIWYIASLHDPIESDGKLFGLSVYLDENDRRVVGTYYGSLYCQWSKYGVFAFPILES